MADRSAGLVDVPAFAVRGACPGVGRPMEAADGLLLRVRCPGGALRPHGLRALAGVAGRYGSGVIELTVRANFQLRGIDPDEATAAAEVLVRSGLAHPDPGRDERRDVVGSPLAGHDPAELVDLSRIVARIADRLATEPGLDGLPPKFGVVVDGGGAATVRSVPADVCAGAVRRDGRVVLQLALGRSLDADDGRVHIEVDELESVMLAAAHRSATDGERIAPLVDRLGRTALAEAFGARHEVAADRPTPEPPYGSDHLPPTGGPPHRDADEQTLEPPESFDHRPPIGVPPHRGTDERTPKAPGSSDPRPPIGVLPHRDAGRVNVAAAPFLGRTSATALGTVADLAEATGAEVRLTPWRSVVLVGVARSRAGWMVERLMAAGFSADPDDPAHLVSACVGSAGCASSHADTQAAARDRLGRSVTGRIHLSGCEKRCGAGSGTALVLVAEPPAAGAAGEAIAGAWWRVADQPHDAGGAPHDPGGDRTHDHRSDQPHDAGAAPASGMRPVRATNEDGT